MRVYKRKDSKYWWISVEAPNGRRLRRSSETTDKKEAKLVEATWQKEVWKQKHLDEKPRRYWLEAVTQNKNQNRHPS